MEHLMEIEGIDRKRVDSAHATRAVEPTMTDGSSVLNVDDGGIPFVASDASKTKLRSRALRRLPAKVGTKPNSIRRYFSAVPTGTHRNNAPDLAASSAAGATMPTSSTVGATMPASPAAGATMPASSATGATMLASSAAGATMPAQGPETKVRKLRRVSKKQSNKRKLVDRDEANDEYEVEKIVSHKGRGEKILYEVKWVGWTHEHNTFEPVENLRSSLAVLADYYQNLLHPGSGHFFEKGHVEALRTELSLLDENVIKDLCARHLTELGHNITIDEEDVEENLINLSRLPPSARHPALLQEVKSRLQLLEFRKRREKQLDTMKEWLKEVEKVSTSTGRVEVYNGVDLDVINPEFHFVNNVFPGVGVNIPENNPLSCDCVGNCFTKRCCWFGQWEERPYTKNGRLRYARGTPIFECNKNCKCDRNCGNRILQNGRTVPLAIFKTKTGAGWGVRALEPIKEGQFVVEYVGEIINFDVAESRGRTYDKNGCTYLFDLDFNDEDKCPYTIDAAFYGNVSHFINHSCDPNLNVFAVFVDCLDKNLPRLGLYASRNIKANEELCFDYMLELNSIKKEPSDKQTVCCCNSEQCRKVSF